MQGKPTTRFRKSVYSFGDGSTKETSPSGGSVGSSRTVGPTIAGTQKTVSSGHPYTQLRKKKLVGDIGGDFFTSRTYVVEHSNYTRSIVTKRTTTPQNTIVYSGPILPMHPVNFSYPAPLTSSDDDLDEKGATAIARCKPTNSVADASTFLGELLKDGLPHMLGAAIHGGSVSRPRNWAEEFLNLEFGLLPIYNDGKKFVKAVSNADKVLTQFERDAGKVVRRTYNFPIERTRTEQRVLDPLRNYPYFPGDGSPLWRDLTPGLVLGNAVRIDEKIQTRWFSGAFTYHLPTGTDSRSEMSKYALLVNKLLGTNVTPELLWNLAPWSWAADWFSNTGDVLSNLSDWSTYGLVLRYGYIMEHTISKSTYTWSGNSGLRGGVLPAPVTLVNETKVRRRANPFGFGVSWDGLSPLQLAITAALGLTRS